MTTFAENLIARISIYVIFVIVLNTEIMHAQKINVDFDIFGLDIFLSVSIPGLGAKNSHTPLESPSDVQISIRIEGERDLF